MNPLQAIWSAMLYVCGTWPSRRQGIPGEVIERMSPETRQALSQLKSEDISPEKLRREEVYFAEPLEYSEDKKFRQARLDFDQKIRKIIPEPKKY